MRSPKQKKDIGSPQKKGHTLQLRQRIRRVFGSMVLFFNIAVIAFLVLSVYGVSWFATSTPLFSYIGLSFPFWVIVNLLFMLFWLIKFDWRVCFSILAFALTYQAFQNYFPLNFSTQLRPVNSYKILTYNVQYFNICTPHTERAPNKIIRFIQDENADIVCIQEYGYSAKKQHLQQKDILKALKIYTHRAIVNLSKKGMKSSAIAIFSKFPIRNVVEIDLGSDYNGAMSCEIKIEDKWIRLVNTHLETNQMSLEDRNKFEALTESPSTNQLNSFLRNTIPKIGMSFRKRANQADQIRRVIPKDSMRLIVCGDLNDTPNSNAYNTLREDLSDAFVDNGFGPGITYNQKKFYLRIDHIFYSSGIKFYQTNVPQVKYSDHYPVIGYFTLVDQSIK